MILLASANNGEVMIDGLPYAKLAIRLLWDRATESMAIVYDSTPHTPIVTLRPFGQYSTSSGAFADFDALIAFVRVAFFGASGIGGADGSETVITNTDGSVNISGTGTIADPYILAAAAGGGVAPAVIDAVRHAYPGEYNAFPLAIATPDGYLRLFFTNSTSHVAFARVDELYTNDPELKIWSRRTIIEDLTGTLSYKDVGGGIGIDGDIFIAATAYSFTGVTTPDEFGTYVKVSVYRSSNDFATYTKVCDTLPINGNAYASSYGNLVVMPDGEMQLLVYGGTVELVYIVESTDGVVWTVKSNIWSGGGVGYNESSIVYLPGAVSTATAKGVAFSRADGLTNTHMAYTDDGGATWTDAGEILNSSTKLTSPDAVLSPDGLTIHVIFANRANYTMVLEWFDFSVEVIEAATPGGITGSDIATLGTDAQVGYGVSYESVVNLKDRATYGQVAGHFGNPRLVVFNDRVFYFANDLAPFHAPPYDGYDDVQVDLIGGEFRPRFPVASIGILPLAYYYAFPTAVPVAIPLNLPVTARNNGFHTDGNAFVIPVDGEYEFSANVAVVGVDGQVTGNLRLEKQDFDTAPATKAQRIDECQLLANVNHGGSFRIYRRYQCHKGDKVGLYFFDVNGFHWTVGVQCQMVANTGRGDGLYNHFSVARVA